MTMQELIHELREVEYRIFELNTRLGKMNQEAIDIHNELNKLHGQKARVVVDLTSAKLEVI